MEVLQLGLIGLRCAVAFIFILYGVSKLLAPRTTFEVAIAEYKLVPIWAIRPIAYVLPTLEVLLGALFLFDSTFLFAGVSLLVLLAPFQVAISKALVTGLEITCGCNSRPRKTRRGLTFSFIRNWALIIALLVVGRLDISGIEPTRFNIWFAVATLGLAVSVPVFPFLSRAITRAIRQHTIPAISANAGRRRFLFQSLAVAVGIVGFSFGNAKAALACGGPVPHPPTPANYKRCNEVQCFPTGVEKCYNHYMYAEEKCYDYYDASYCFPEWLTAGEC